MRAERDAAALQRGLQNPTHRDQRGGDSAGKMPAAAIVLEAVVFAIGGVVGVRGPREAVLVVAAARVFVGDDEAQGSAGRAVVKNAA